MVDVYGLPDVETLTVSPDGDTLTVWEVDCEPLESPLTVRVDLPWRQAPRSTRAVETQADGSTSCVDTAVKPWVLRCWCGNLRFAAPKHKDRITRCHRCQAAANRRARAASARRRRQKEQ